MQTAFLKGFIFILIIRAITLLINPGELWRPIIYEPWRSDWACLELYSSSLFMHKKLMQRPRQRCKTYFYYSIACHILLTVFNNETYNRSYLFHLFER